MPLSASCGPDSKNLEMADKLRWCAWCCGRQPEKSATRVEHFNDCFVHDELGFLCRSGTSTRILQPYPSFGW